MSDLSQAELIANELDNLGDPDDGYFEHAPCGCPVVDDVGTVDHTAECLKRQAAEHRARQIAFGALAYGAFLSANPNLLALAGDGAGNNSSFYFWGADARAKIEQFVAAFAADGWTLTEETDNSTYAGVTATRGGFSVRLRTPADALADVPPPPRPAYRPLLAPAGESTAVQR